MKKIKRISTIVTAAMYCMAAFSVGAMAYADDPGVEPSAYKAGSTAETTYYASDESGTDVTVPEAIDEVSISTEVVNIDSDDPLTPEGNLTLVDDISENSGIYSSDEAENKQFITVKTKSGNTFYLIIDRSSDADNVYFLNMVDESDLMTLIDSDDSVTVAECTCTEKCSIGNINTACEVCSANMSACTGTEKVIEEPVESEEPAEAEAEEETPDSGGVNLLPILLILAAAGGGAVWYLKFRKPKPDTKGSTDIDDYFDDQEDEEEPEDEGDDLDDVEFENED